MYPSNFNATTVAPAAGAVSIWLSESAVDLQPFYRDCIKKAQPEPWFYGRAFPRSHWPDGYYEDKSNFHANTLIHSRGWSMTVCWRMAWLGVKEGFVNLCVTVCVSVPFTMFPVLDSKESSWLAILFWWAGPEDWSLYFLDFFEWNNESTTYLFTYK